MKPTNSPGTGPRPSASFGFAADSSGASALEFLERSRDVANEVVVDGKRAETSTSLREETTAPGSRSSV
jgi:hypothetical protein